MPFSASVEESVTRLTLKPASSIRSVASPSVFPMTLGTFSGPSDQNSVTFDPSETWVPGRGLHLDDLVLRVVRVALGEHHPEPLAAQLGGGVVLVLADHVGQRDLGLAGGDHEVDARVGIHEVTGLRLLGDHPTLGHLLAGGRGHLADLETAVADGALGLVAGESGDGRDGLLLGRAT